MHARPATGGATRDVTFSEPLTSMVVAALIATERLVTTGALIDAP